jgi:hypothetical protein
VLGQALPIGPTQVIKNKLLEGWPRAKFWHMHESCKICPPAHGPASNVSLGKPYLLECNQACNRRAGNGIQGASHIFVKVQMGAWLVIFVYEGQN